MAINAQVTPGEGHGVAAVVLGLVSALGRLQDGDEEYVIVGPAERAEWLVPYTGPNQRVVSAPGQPASRRRVESAKRLLGPLRPAIRRVYRRLRPAPPIPNWPEVPVSDGFFEGLGCDVVHLPHQAFTVFARPTIYNPHDLQYRHYPRYYSPRVIAERETIYRAGVQLAHTVVVASDWVKRDVVRHFGVAEEKVQVIPWAPPVVAHREPTEQDRADARARYGLELPFALYPATTWEHKNHLRLLEALALLRDRDGLAVRLVCTGHTDTAFWPEIKRAIAQLDLGGQVRFLGVVPGRDLRALYRLCQFVVVPTLFEAASGPVFEAWAEGAPVACSKVTSLPEQVGQAGLLFDPLSIEAIAGAVQRMAEDADQREALRRRGARRVREFSWERTARAYRAVYRRAARQPLNEEDRALLARDWMREPTEIGGRA